MEKKVKKRLSWLLAFSLLGTSVGVWSVDSGAQADDGAAVVPVVKMLKNGEDISSLTVKPSGVTAGEIAFLIGLDGSGTVWTHSGSLVFRPIQKQVVTEWQAVKQTTDTIHVNWQDVGDTVQAGETLSVFIDTSGFQVADNTYQRVYATLVADDGGEVAAHGVISPTDHSTVVTSATYEVPMPADDSVPAGSYTLYIYVYTENSGDYTASVFESKEIKVTSAVQGTSPSPEETDTTPPSSPAETSTTSPSSPAETDTTSPSAPVETSGTSAPPSSAEESIVPGKPESPVPSPVATTAATGAPASNQPNIVTPPISLPTVVPTQVPTASAVPQASAAPTTSAVPSASAVSQASAVPSASEVPVTSGVPTTSEVPAVSMAPIASEMPASSAAPLASKTPDASALPVQAPDAENQAPEPGVTEKQGNVTYKVTESGSVAVDKVGTAKAKKNVAIPDTVTVAGKTYKVDTISAGAFSGNGKIEKVTLGKNIKKIEKNAFKGCKNLEQVTFSNKVTTVGAKSFFGCTSLKKVTLPSSVKTIGARAFKGCKSIKNIQIGKKSQTVKGGAVSAVPYIRTSKQGVVTVETVPLYSAGSSPALTIGNYAFAACSSMKKVIINSAVRVIGSSAFRGCKKLSDITVNSKILETVKKMALKGINNCTITVPSSKFKPYCTLFRNKGQGKKVLIAKA